MAGARKMAGARCCALTERSPRGDGFVDRLAAQQQHGAVRLQGRDLQQRSLLLHERHSLPPNRPPLPTPVANGNGAAAYEEDCVVRGADVE